MDLFCIKCSKFIYNNNVEIKHEIHKKIKLYSYCIDSSFKKIETNDRDQISYLIKKFEPYIRQCYHIILIAERMQKKN